MLRLTVEHAYWGADRPPVVLEPDVATQGLLRHPSLAMKSTPAAIDVFAEADREALRNAVGGDTATLCFRLRTTDRTFVAYTDIFNSAQQGLAVLSVNAGAVTTPKATDIRALKVSDVLTAADLARPPLAVLLVDIPVDASNDARTIRFEASHWRWIYHVVGGDAAQALEVRDPEGRVSFAPLGVSQTPNGTDSRPFRSEVTIEASTRPSQRFELVAPGEFGDRVLIAVLPTPSAMALRPDRDEPGGPLVADIYVNLP